MKGFLELYRYKRLLNRAYVDDNPALRWCPGPDCDLAIECHVPIKSLDAIVPSVKCDCGHAFCFGCGLTDHQPCICPLVKKWLQKCKDDSETANWISANTKECPKCMATIEKNGGCNVGTVVYMLRESKLRCVQLFTAHDVQEVQVRGQSTNFFIYRSILRDCGVL